MTRERGIYTLTDKRELKVLRMGYRSPSDVNVGDNSWTTTRMVRYFDGFLESRYYKIVTG